MRLWSLHPRYLDRQGLTAAWREALLAQSVVIKGGGGYANHPQVERFRSQADPLAALGEYLAGIADEAHARGYRFDAAKIRTPPGDASGPPAMTVTTGQLALEWQHLLGKLQRRSPDVHARLAGVEHPDPHPSLVEVPGPVATWERQSTNDERTSHGTPRTGIAPQA
ncbi:pyrimidine dimer DNA glycosylase/endonuclease V [Georgenia sp. Z1491]|uniref:pyrimidine dimer DNA glycosylase/endonuclease V n=1 Tax=Georgenia sp. Z1491 TaxID=3416707 RepID=UPI003CF3C8E7